MNKGGKVLAAENKLEMTIDGSDIYLHFAVSSPEKAKELFDQIAAAASKFHVSNRDNTDEISTIDPK
jgi:hypothetical protein